MLYLMMDAEQGINDQGWSGKEYRISGEIVPLTSFRFVIAFIVFLFHIHINFRWGTGVQVIDQFINNSAIFMSAFFILSGFILIES